MCRTVCVCVVLVGFLRFADQIHVWRWGQTLFRDTVQLSSIPTLVLRGKTGGRRHGSGRWPAGIAAGGPTLVDTAGRVYAEDIDPKALAKTTEWAAREGLQNVETVLGAPDDPRLPAASLDAAVILNTHHEFENPDAIFSRLSISLKPGGRLVVIDIMPSSTQDTRKEQQITHALAPSHAESDLRKAGFHILVRDDSFTDVPLTTSRYWLIVASR